MKQDSKRGVVALVNNRWCVYMEEADCANVTLHVQIKV
jgi:hypothetical protein